MEDEDDEQVQTPIEPEPAGRDPRADELDGLRIRQLSALRRGAYRARSFAIILGVACLAAAIGFFVQAIKAIGWGYRAILAVLALLAFFGVVHFARRVAELQREIRTPPPMPPEPPGGPDFSTLSDGSQQWRNLEDIR